MHECNDSTHGRPHRRLSGGRSLIARLLLALALTLPLAACSATSNKASTSAASSTVASAATAAVSGAATPTTGLATATTVASTPIVATPAPTSTAAATPTPASAALGSGAASPAAAAPAATVDAIKNVIQQANQEQQEAYAKHDPTVMRDTATPDYFNQLVQGLSELASSGVAAINLINLQWGTITLQNPTTASATTSETWGTTFIDGSTLKETDTNVYSLVEQGGAWKIAEDEHPDTRILQPPPGTPGAAPTPQVPSGPTGSSNQSRNWAGYNATGGTFTAVSGTWTVPSVGSGTSPAADAIWVGIGGVDSRDLIQAGTSATVQSGQVSYDAWIETLPQASQPVSLPVKAGDSISVAITQQANGSWQILIHNATSGQDFKTTLNYQSSRSSAEWVAESPAVGRRLLLPLDDFGTVKFTGSTAVENGQQRTIAQTGATPITLVSSAGQPLAQTSALGADGESFTVTRTSAPAPGIAPPGTADVPSVIQPN